MASADKSIKEVPQPVKKPEPQPPKFDPRQVAALLDRTSEDTPQQKQASISEADPAWQVVEDKSPIDDFPQVAAALNSKAGNLQLVMRCKERQVEVAVIAREGLGMNFRNEIKVLFRLNDLPAQTVTWTEFQNRKSGFFARATLICDGHWRWKVVCARFRP